MATEDFKYLLTDNTGQTIATAEQARNTTLIQIKDALGTFNSHMDAWAGALSSLTTGDKSSLVNAINWVLAKENTHESNKAMHDVYDYLDAASDGYRGAGIHNSLYRGKNLGESLTADQIARINDGTFKGLWLGDCWQKSITFNYLKAPVDPNDSLISIAGDDTTTSTTISPIMQIADYNYFRKACDLQVTQKHLTIVPLTALYEAPINQGKADTTTGYVGSDMRTKYLAGAVNAFNAFFGSSHILSYTDLLQNAAVNGRASGIAWYDCKVELMDERQVFGCYVLDSGAMTDSYNSVRNSVTTKQFNLFRVCPEVISNWIWYWLRNIANTRKFVKVNGKGCSDQNSTSYMYGVRPFANIY